MQRDEEQLRALIELAPDGIFIADLEGRYVDVNEAGCRMLGYRREELIGKRILDLVPPEDARRLAVARERLVRGAVETEEWILLRRDGKPLPVEISARILEDGRWLGFVRDVSERRRLEQQLEHSLEALSHAQAVAQMGSWYLDIGSDELHWSAETYRIFAVEPGSRMSLQRFLECVHPEDRGYVEASWRAALHGEPYDIEHRIVTRGETRWVRERAELEFTPGGGLLGGVGTVQDITDSKRKELALRGSEERVRQLLECSGEGIFGIDRAGRCTFINPAGLKLLGLATPSELVGKRIHDQIHGRRGDGAPHPVSECRVYRAVLEGQGYHVDDESFVRADGSSFEVEYRSFPIRRCGEIIGAVATFADISERKQAERLLRQAAIVFESSMQGIAITDAEGRIVAVNPAYTTITGLRGTDVVGKPLGLQRAGRHSRAFYQRVLGTLRDDGSWQGEVWNRRRNGQAYPALESISVVRDDAGRITNYVNMLSDISALKKVEEELSHLAHHDSLTGLANRLLLNATLTKSLQRARRHRTRVALLFMDLDRFKVINDSLGHVAGDRLLRIVGRRLQGLVRKEDTVARLGGDEFTILLEDVNDPEDAAHLAAKVNAAVGRPLTISGREVVTSASIGISLFPGDAETAADLIKAADAAMYRAKAKGRNTFEFYVPEMTARAQEHLLLEQGLRRALASGSLKLHYQPQLDLASGQIVGVEALLRWEHPEEGLISPARFLDVAEESGLITRIGEWVIREVYAQAAVWKAAGLTGLRIGVNLSGRQLARDHLAATIESALRRSGLGPGEMTLELEVTEGMLQSVEEGLECLQKLRGQGVLIAIDDFGTGYSSLSRLKHLPIDTLKVDQAFVRNLPEAQDNQAITAAVVAMGHSLGLRVIAEGVETEPQLNILREQGCDEVQGFLIGRAMPAPAIAQLLGRRGGAAPRRP